MVIREAIDQRVPRIRKAVWTNPNCYLRLPLMKGGMHGPWAELYDDTCQQQVLNIRPGSQRMGVGFDIPYEDPDWERYEGPVSEFEKDPDNYAKVYEEA